MKPLAFRVRPNSFDEIIGQDHLVGKNGVIRKMIDNNQICSLILYGPAGCGKTSIAHVISTYYSLQAAAGLYNNFGSIKFKYGTTNDANKGYFTSITNGTYKLLYMMAKCLPSKIILIT